MEHNKLGKLRKLFGGGLLQSREWPGKIPLKRP